MAKEITLVLLCLLSLKTYSQKCKTDKDPFTNEEITSFNFYNKSVYFELKNDSIKFDIKFHYWGERKHEFKEGTQIFMKFENGLKTNFKTTKKAKPTVESITSSFNAPFFPRFGGGFSTTSSENYTAYSFTFLINKTELKNLAESKIEIIRVPDTDEEEHVDLRAKGRTKRKIKAIRKGAKCIAQNI